MNNSSLDDLLAKQTAAENAYYQAGSPSSGPIYNAYISALNAVDKLQTQIENTNYNTPGVEYKPAPVIVDETGRITGAVAQPGGLTAVPLSNVDTNPAPVDPQVAQDLENGSGTDVAVPTEDIKKSAADVSPSTDPSAYLPGGIGSFTGAVFGLDAAGAAAGKAVVGAAQAQNQETNSSLAQQPRNTDWRVTLRLAPGATYLYNAADAGLLQPLKVTNP